MWRRVRLISLATAVTGDDVLVDLHNSAYNKNPYKLSTTHSVLNWVEPTLANLRSLIHGCNSLN